ncbi:MAG: hypothetical protein ABR591_04615 [Candidatus Velthaea sp.]
MRLHHIIAGASALVLAAAAAESAAPERLQIRGTITSFTAERVVVQTAKGPITVGMTPKTIVVGATPGHMSDIVPGAFLGIANAPGKSGAEALEVSVFDEKLRGVGEGDGPWQAPEHRTSAMTNGTVAPATHAAMTNGTVEKAGGNGAKTITVAYKGGSKKIVVPANAPIVHVAPGSATLLKRKASVFMSAAKHAGAVTANFIVVGEHGTVVPL